jgi:hypothetical protein
VLWVLICLMKGVSSESLLNCDVCSVTAIVATDRKVW